MANKQKRREAKLRKQQARAQQSTKTGLRPWIWVLLAFAVVTGMVWQAQLTATPPAQAKISASAERSSQPNGSPFSPDEEVLAYMADTSGWQWISITEVAQGQEFQWDDRLCYLDQRGLLRMKPHVNLAELAATDRLPPDTTRRFPDPTDIVRFVREDATHARFDRMGTLGPKSRFFFQGRLYEGVGDPGSRTGLSIRDTGIVLARVTNTFKRKVEALIDLTVADEAGHAAVITGTAEHPFFVPARDEYVPMGNLESGMVLETIDETIVTVASIARREEAADVYNFEVEEHNNYYVAADERFSPVLVHNICIKDFVRLKRSRQLANDIDAKRIFKLTDDELDFVGDVLEAKPNLQIFRTNQRAKIGDFLIVDRSNPRDAIGFVVDHKGSGKNSAGNQLSNADFVKNITELRINRIDTGIGDTERILELIGHGKKFFPQDKKLRPERSKKNKKRRPKRPRHPDELLPSSGGRPPS